MDKVNNNLWPFHNGSTYSRVPASSSPQNLLKPEIKADVTEFSSQKKNLKTNKKLLIGGIIAGVAILSAFIFRKNIAKLLKPAKKQVVSQAEILPKNLYETYIHNAHEFLIDNVRKLGEATASGICFYGPDSIGKERLIEGFVKDLADADYRIVRVPRAKDASIKEIRAALSRSMKEAEECFQNTKQRTAIVIRDLDTIAPDRNIELVNNATGVLMQGEKCRERGYALITEAKEIDKIDVALLRRGRTDHFIPSKPSKEDGKEIWNTYIETIKKYVIKDDKEKLIQDALDSLN